MKRRNFLKTTALGTSIALPLGVGATSTKPNKKQPLGTALNGTLLVLAATPGGISTAIAAAKEGLKVTLLDRTPHIGGLVANGLGATDIMTKGATAGNFLAFVNRILKYYTDTYGADSQQVKDCAQGYHFEPHVAEQILTEMLAEHPSITVLQNRQFDFDKRANIKMDGDKISSIKVLNRETGEMETYSADVFIDASYEGDLAAAAGVPYYVGRESQSQHGEYGAGVIYKYWAGPVDEDCSTGMGDNAIQAYNYRLCLTTDPKDYYPISQPENYNRAEFISLVDDVNNMHCTDYRIAQIPLAERQQAIKERFETGLKMSFRQYRAGMNCVVNIVGMPNGKTDANNHHIAFISTDLPEENWPYPTSGWVWRDRYAKRLREYTLGLLWFCQNDEALPEWFRKDCKRWGLSKSEYTDNEHFPRQVYVREGRRIEGKYLFTAHDVRSENEARPRVHPSSITSSHYPLDSHAVRKREPNRPHLEGMLSFHVKPYTVPLEVMIPKKVSNLICPVPASATHIGFATLRMEPCWFALGQAAGVTAAQMIAKNLSAQSVEVKGVQETLLKQGAKLVYFKDLPNTHPHYAAIQMLALSGKLKEWELQPDAPITESAARAWSKAFGIAKLSLTSGETRGKYLSRIYQQLG